MGGDLTTFKPRPVLLSVLVTTSMDKILLSAVFEYSDNAFSEAELNRSDPQKRIRKGSPTCFRQEKRRDAGSLQDLKGRDIVLRPADRRRRFCPMSFTTSN
jgi:hypothetical protein